jgi:hypothetical protein
MTHAWRGLVLAGLGVLALVAGVAAQGGGAVLDRRAPDIVGGPWINSAPLTPGGLLGRVVYVEFWTYG